MANDRKPARFGPGKLSPQSEFVVQRGLRQLMADYRLTWPMDVFALVKQIQEAGKIRLTVLQEKWHTDGLEGFTERMQDGSYVIHIKPVPENWRDRSELRRHHFSLAHELGHIFCRHQEERPTALQTDEEKDRDNAEADEFAGRLLMPEALVCTAQIRSISAAADAFLVSNNAMRRRLANLGRPILLRGPFRDVCVNCGNDRLRPEAQWCDICGAWVGVPQCRQGVLTVDYARPAVNRMGQRTRCPTCGNGQISYEAVYCRHCGTPVKNRCNCFTQFCTHVNSPGARFCEKCGQPALFRAFGMLPDWRQEREEWIRRIVNAEEPADPPEEPLLCWPKLVMRHGLMADCPHCGKRQRGYASDNCIFCGGPIRNTCLSPARHGNADNAAFCEFCGERCVFAPFLDVSAEAAQPCTPRTD